MDAKKSGTESAIIEFKNSRISGFRKIGQLSFFSNGLFVFAIAVLNLRPNYGRILDLLNLFRCFAGIIVIREWVFFCM